MTGNSSQVIKLRAILAIGEVSWDYQNLTPPLASECRGTRDEKFTRSEPSSPARFEQSVYSLINTDGFEIERFLISLSIASCKVATL